MDSVYVIHGAVCEWNEEEQIYSKYILSDVIGVYKTLEDAFEFFKDMKDARRADLPSDDSSPCFIWDDFQFDKNDNKQRAVYFIKEEIVKGELN